MMKKMFLKWMEKKRTFSMTLLVLLLVLGSTSVVLGQEADMGNNQSLSERKEKAEEEKRRSLQEQSLEYRAKFPVYNAEKEARKQRERDGLPPLIQERKQIQESPMMSMTEQNKLTTEWTGVVEVRGAAVDGLQASFVALRNANVEASERITQAPSLDSLPDGLRRKLHYDEVSQSMVLKDSIDRDEYDALRELFTTTEDLQAVERLIQPRYQYGKSLFFFLKLYNLYPYVRTLEALPAHGSLSRSDTLQFRIETDYSDVLILRNPYEDTEDVHEHPPLVVSGGGQLEAWFDLNEWIHLSGKLREMLESAKKVTITAEIPGLNLRSEPFRVLIKQ